MCLFCVAFEKLVDGIRATSADEHDDHAGHDDHEDHADHKDHTDHEEEEAGHEGHAHKRSVDVEEEHNLVERVIS